MANQKTESSVPDFEAALKKLEAIVANMEGGKLSLESALKQFEEGVALTRRCQALLSEAEQRVEKLSLNDEPNASTLPEDPRE